LTEVLRIAIIIKKGCYHQWNNKWHRSQKYWGLQYGTKTEKKKSRCTDSDAPC